MKITLDQNMIQSMSLFQNLTGSSVMDCVQEDDEIYFVVAEGQYGLSVGKGGVKIKNAERVFKKNIKVFEYFPEIEKFLKSAIPEIQEISIGEKDVLIKVKPSDKPKVIGKGGKNIKIIGKIVERLFDKETVKIKN